MRVLQVHKTFYPTGGADTFFFKTCDLLTEHGHDVAHFSTKHAKNQLSPYAAYFVDGFNDSDVPHLSLARKAKAFRDGIYCFDARKKLSQLLKDFKPDVAHAHSINYQLSPSVFSAFRKSGVPVVITLHDYQIICGAGSLYVDDAVCERCRGGQHYNLLRHSCYWNLPASLMATLNHYVHDGLHSWDVASKLLSPSRFLKEKLTEFGVPAERITHIPIFIDFLEQPLESRNVGEYVLYFGRLAPNKGTKVLLDAAKAIDYKFLLIGDGPLSGWVEEQCAASRGKVQRLAFVSSREELGRYIERAAFSVIPSVWYENQPATILETYAMSRPVIGSRLGGIPELIDQGHTGLLCEPGNAADLAEKIRFMLERPDLCREWGRNGNHKLSEGFSRAAHYERLMAIYSSVLSQN
jgi:glycosyltransferase involved in cell wall biosynthesis